MAVTSFFKETRDELQKVTWPTREQIIRLTAIVLVISGVVGLYIGGLDFLFTKAFEFLLQ
jgi:preprotein translocase subunit SecE